MNYARVINYHISKLFGKVRWYDYNRKSHVNNKTE